MATLLPNGKQQFVDGSGNPLVGGKVYHYEVGTSTAKTTWLDSDQQSANANPVILDGRGQASIYGSGAYRQVAYDAANNLIWDQVVVDAFQYASQLKGDLANQTDAAKGTALVAGKWFGGATGKVSDLGGNSGASLLGFIADPSASVARSVQNKLRERISIFDFMTAAQIADVKAMGATLDLSGPLQAARDYLAGFPGHPPRLVFPAGRYGYTTSPNWAIDHADIVADGQVYLRNTGTGHSVIIDGGATAGGVYGLRFGWGNKFIVEGGATSLDGVYCRSVLQGCKFGFQVNGAGTTYSGVNVEFAVCAEFDVTCSNNVQGYTWYSKPAIGLKLSQRGAGELCSYCLFPSPIIEGLNVCAQLDYAQGNVFVGGTLEGAGSVGLLLTANAIKNKVIGTDFEVNTDHDIYCLGRGNEFIGCNTEKIITLDGAAVINKVIGGSHSKITATGGTVNNLVADATYNQNADGSTITDLSGGKLRLRDNYNQGLGRLENSVPSSFVINVTASPFTFTNLGVNDVSVAISGGTITKIEILRNGVYTDIGLIAGMVTLTGQDAVRVTYSAGLPVMTGFTR